MVIYIGVRPLKIICLAEPPTPPHPRPHFNVFGMTLFGIVEIQASRVQVDAFNRLG